MKVINNDKCGIIIKSWCENIDDNALAQAYDLSNLPFVFKHIALMPDCHMGYGMPIGGVMATNGEVIPNAVGVDIGCGMSAVQTNLAGIDIDLIKNIFSDIREQIPVGFNHRDKPMDWDGFELAPTKIAVVDRELESARKQIGTLGGGNHFIELQKGNDGFIWIMIHSGSRNIGYKIANEFHKLAKVTCERYYSHIPTDELSFFPRNDQNHRDYSYAMNFALAFAKENRRIMMSECKEILNTHTSCEFNEEINIHHNYAQMENHFGKNVLVHRKGATRAYKDEYGIIPGSQGTKSYIVKGLGNPESFMSCSHGAGRVMGRKQATRELNLKNVIAGLDKKGIIHSIRNQNDLDEAPQAYKNINTVMSAQNDLVEIVVELSPLGVIKG